jgi:two-component system sensor histidine kinase UhpB
MGTSCKRSQDLAGRLIRAQEEERRRIARDLHDDVAQELAGVAITLSGLQSKVGEPALRLETERTVVDLQARVAGALESIRTLSRQLHPGVLQHLGLVAALKRHCNMVREHYQLDVRFCGEDGLESLSPDAALCLFRVAQEALSNTVRHARARLVTVRVQSTGERVELTVADDGVGFRRGERAGAGLGLRSIDERVRLVRGDARIESQPGFGTRLTVSIPMIAVADSLAGA